MVVNLDESLVEQARRGRLDAVHTVLAQLSPAVTRVAMALAGREDVGHGIVTFVLRQGARQHARWNDPAAPWRWFIHHTVLTSRRASRHLPTGGQEVLQRGEPDASYAAFLRAIRLLPVQQREAILLSCGEGLSGRSLAIAMDCSTSAAANHLAAARNALAPIAGTDFEPLLARLHDCFVQLTPPEDSLTPAIRDAIRHVVVPRRLKRIVLLAALAAMLIAGLWLYFRFFPR